MTSRQAELVEMDGPLEAIESIIERGWTDGLPVIPPTVERVDAMLASVEQDPADVVGRLPERRRAVVLEKLAINAVMAGCRPAYFPVVVAAVEAISDPAFGLHGTSASTAGAAPLVIVHGPIATRLGMNHGTSLFGPGNRANATIGRAVTLIQRNCFGAIPGSLDRAIVGHAGKLSFCVAESEQESPWESLGVARGLATGESGVTVFAGEASRQIHNETGRSPEEILATYAAAIADPTNMGAPGGEYVVVIVPEHREYLARAGWTRRQVQEFVFERATVRPEDFERAGKEWRFGDEPRRVPASPDAVLVLAAGGDGGGKGAVVPPWMGRTQAVTRPIVETG